MSHEPDSEHDAWLHEALRHAPDAQITPPASISELILREAQAKARSAVPPVAAPRATGLAAFWDWLARPSVAAGAASLMIATLAGVMWWDRPIDPERAPMPPAAAPAVPEAKTSDQAGEAAPAASPELRQYNAAAPPEVVTSPPPPERALAKTEAAAKRVAPDRESSADAKKERARLAQAAPRPFPAAPAADRVPVQSAAGAAQDTTTNATADKPAAAAQPARTAMAPVVPTPAAAPAPAPTVAPSNATPPLRERSELAAGGVASTRRADVAEMQKSAGALAAKEAAPTDIVALRQAIANEPRRWTWQRAGTAAQAVNARLRNWLAQADVSASPGWRRVPLTTPAEEQRDAVAITPSHELRLLRDGRLIATLRLDTASLRLESAPSEGHAASAWQATLAPDAAQALAQSFP